MENTYHWYFKEPKDEALVLEEAKNFMDTEEVRKTCDVTELSITTDKIWLAVRFSTGAPAVKPK